MVMYEVNLTINKTIFTEFFAWLIPHAKEICQFRGFIKAEVAKEQFDSPEIEKLTVRYFIESQAALDEYLDQHALIMREDAVKRFGSNFSAIRRVFNEPIQIDIA